MYRINKKFIKSSYHIVDLKLCSVRLNDNSKFPWLILIPKRKNITDMTRLTGNSMILIQCNKLKAIARDTKRLMQEFVKELNETIEIAKRKYDEKLLE